MDYVGNKITKDERFHNSIHSMNSVMQQFFPLFEPVGAVLDFLFKFSFASSLKRN